VKIDGGITEELECGFLNRNFVTFECSCQILYIKGKDRKNKDRKGKGRKVEKVRIGKIRIRKVRIGKLGSGIFYLRIRS